MQKMLVNAVVVTYNRKALLMECLEAVFKQSVCVNKVILIDNASTDGTYELLKEKGFLDNEHLVYLLMDKNLGCSGGVYEGIKQAIQMDCEWIWVMDDDTIPTETCLEELLLANEVLLTGKNRIGMREERNISFLASAVYGSDGEYMNVPGVSLRPSSNGYPYWYSYLNEGIVTISVATFVSILFKREAIIRCGLPCKDFFIWGDDSEYTMRLTKFYGDGFFVGKSIAIHKRLDAKTLSVENETDVKRIKMYRYYYRNQLINLRYYFHRNYPIYDMLKSFLIGLRYLRKPNGIEMAKAVIRGNWEGITQYNKFKKYIDNQLEGVKSREIIEGTNKRENL